MACRLGIICLLMSVSLGGLPLAVGALANVCLRDDEFFKRQGAFMNSQFVHSITLYHTISA